ERADLFFDILELSPSLLEQIKYTVWTCFDSYGEIVDDHRLAQLATMLISLIYLCRNCTIDLSIEFLCALFTNIILAGHIGPISIHKNQNNSELLNLESDCDHLHTALSRYEPLPCAQELSHFKPRITHFYVAFQHCLQNI